MDKIPDKTDLSVSSEEMERELKFWRQALQEENRMLERMIDSLNSLHRKLSVNENKHSGNS